VADLPFEFADATLTARLARAVDVEGKIARALDALGPIADRDVVLLDGGGGLRARQLADLGGRVTAVERRADAAGLLAARDLGPGVALAVGEPSATGLPSTTADVVAACWSAFRGPDGPEFAEATRLLRPGGRLLVLHDYGRDDVSRLQDPGRPEYTTWSRRDGPFLAGGFRIRVIHCWWTFDSLEEATSLVREGFGSAGEPVAAALVRPRLSYNVAVYHRTMPGATRS